MSSTVAAFYQFAELSPDDVAELVRTVTDAATAQALTGTVLIAAEGLNVAVAGDPAGVESFVAWLRLDPRFTGVSPRYSTGTTPPFGHLEVKAKRWIIRFADGDDPAVEAVRVGARTSPAELAALLAMPRPDVTIVDTRNLYETDHGRFAGAATLPLRSFSDFPRAFVAAYPDAADREFVFYCTGGIRCEKAVAWAAARGYRASQLDGGILGYFAAEGGAGFDGQCVVFDNRWLVDGTLAECDAAPDAPRLQSKSRGSGPLRPSRPLR